MLTGRNRFVAQAATRPRSGERALDWFAFFVAAIQAGFGPFMAVYLSEHSWTQRTLDWGSPSVVLSPWLRKCLAECWSTPSPPGDCS